MSKKALIVGIDFYHHISPLYGCVDDAYNLKSVIARHGDGSVNFDVRLLTGTGPGDIVSRKKLRDAVQELFEDDSEIALFYFAGHGYIDSIDGRLCASDTVSGDDGLSLSDIVAMANKSPARNRLIVLDSCHAGVAGAPQGGVIPIPFAWFPAAFGGSQRRFLDVSEPPRLPQGVAREQVRGIFEKTSRS